jgi:hypothetical protein
LVGILTMLIATEDLKGKQYGYPPRVAIKGL